MSDVRKNEPVFRRGSIIIAVAVLLIVCAPWGEGLSVADAVTAAAQPQPTAPRTVLDRWERRLEALTPMAPRGYFELAEEIVDLETSGEALNLARQLFAMAGRLDPAGFGRSACLALAAIEPDERQRHRQRAMASLLSDPPLHMPQRGRFADVAGTETARSVLEVFGHVRRGRMAEAAEVARRPGADALIELAGPLLPGGGARLRGYFRSIDGRSGSPYSQQETVRMLVVESMLLQGSGPGRFGLAVLASDDAPLMELELDRLGDVLVCDPQRPWFRNRAWHAEPPARASSREP